MSKSPTTEDWARVNGLTDSALRAQAAGIPALTVDVADLLAVHAIIEHEFG